MKLIIAGTRTFNDYHLLKMSVAMITALVKEDIEIVSGTSEGADKLGEQYAKEFGYNVKRFPADWDYYGKSAGYMRNLQMAEYATHCICFWDGKSKGTKMMIDLCISKKLVYRVIKY